MGQAENPYGFWPCDDDAKLRQFPEATSQTFAAGDAVYLASGAVTIATAATTEILGVAAMPSSGTAGTQISVWHRDDTEFYGRASGANDVEEGTYCDIEGTTGEMQLNENATSTNVALIVNRVNNDEVTTAAGVRWRFRFTLHQLAEQSGV